jgi:hypothetical protein
MHAIIVPFMILHWILNQNTCVLTIIEKHIRSQLTNAEIKNEDCFTCRLIEPIYDFTNDIGSLTVFVYIVTISLWFVTVGKLIYKYNNGEFNL